MISSKYFIIIFIKSVFFLKYKKRIFLLMSCKIDLIESAADKCAFVKENCHMEVQIPFT